MEGYTINMDSKSDGWQKLKTIGETLLTAERCREVFWEIKP